MRPTTLLTPLALLLFAAGTRFAYIQNQGIGANPAFFFDDALITLRYSLNLALGHGFVYNPGEAVLGTTTPLYALLMALPALLGVELSWASAIINGLIDVLIVAALIRMGRGHIAFTIVSAGLFILHPKVLYFSANGMEMSLFCLIAIACTWLFFRERELLAGVAAAAMVICRIDGVLFVGALFLVGLVVRRRIPFRFGAAAAIAFLPWAGYAFARYGSIVPASATAKRIWYAHGAPFDILHLYKGDLLLLPLVAIGLAALFFSTGDRPGDDLLAWLRTSAAWMLFLVGFFIVTRVRIADWYRVPQHLVVALFAGWGAEALLGWLRGRSGRVRSATLTAAALGGILFSLSPVGRSTLRVFSEPFRPSLIVPITEMHLEVARWLEANAKPGETVMTGNIGFIGYYSGCRILDDVGLVSPQVLPYVAEDRLNRARLLSVFEPELVAIERREYEELKPALEEEGYILEATFLFPSQPGHGQAPYRIYSHPDR